MTERLFDRYRRLVAQGNIMPDSAQELAAEKLQLLSNRLATYVPPVRGDFFSFFTRRRGEIPKGLYIYGEVGRGKTMLMDLFFATVSIEKKMRMHFHEFMASVHNRLIEARRDAKEDPVVSVATDIASEVALVCLDEMFVIDIADATILNRLFTALFQNGIIVVMTSNVHPSELYKDGRNRDLFLPFIDLVEEKMEILQLEAQKDYRLQNLASRALYFTPLGADARRHMDELWQRLTFGEPEQPATIEVLGRTLEIPRVSLGAARFEFAQICEQPLGPRDYLAIARNYHTVFVDDIPVLTRVQQSAARRFITLVDTFYDRHTGFIASAATDPEALNQGADDTGHFQRTASRLIEMRTQDYLTKSLAGNGAAKQRLTETSDDLSQEGGASS